MVVIDYSNRLYLVVSNRDGVVKILERGNAGPDQIRRRSGEQEMVGVRHLTVEDFENLFSHVENISGGELVKKWTEANHWQVSQEARAIINRVIWIEDTIEYLRDRAACRNPKKAINKAKERAAKRSAK